MFNTTLPGYDNKDFRQAIAYSIDRDALCNDVLQDGSQPAHNMTMKGLCSNSEGRGLHRGLRAVLRVRPRQGRRAVERRQGQPGPLPRSPSCTTRRRTVAPDLLRVHAGRHPERPRGPHGEHRVHPQGEPPADGGGPRLRRIVLHGWGPDYADPTAILAMYESDHPSNYSQWVNEEFDTLYEKANNEDSGDEAARWEDLKQCNSILHRGGRVPAHLPDRLGRAHARDPARAHQPHVRREVLLQVHDAGRLIDAGRLVGILRRVPPEVAGR